MAALPLSHLSGHSGPLPVRLAGLSAHSPADLSLLAAFLEHPFLEVDATEIRLQDLKKKKKKGELPLIVLRFVLTFDPLERLENEGISKLGEMSLLDILQVLVNTRRSIT